MGVQNDFAYTSSDIIVNNLSMRTECLSTFLRVLVRKFQELFLFVLRNVKNFPHKIFVTCLSIFLLD